MEAKEHAFLFCLYNDIFSAACAIYLQLVMNSWTHYRLGLMLLTASEVSVSCPVELLITTIKNVKNCTSFMFMACCLSNRDNFMFALFYVIWYLFCKERSASASN